MMPGAKNWWIIFPFIHRREGRRGRKRGERRERKVMARLNPEALLTLTVTYFFQQF